ncbi:PAS domain-containing protein [Magnetospirillum sp. SS-4]|uniref:PAS domain-containing protein n=1 Tax=Magnetospirillum sp. SS-4 TaxID=2681465 RepID=UPI001383E4ED|nr:PAS domain-containing protein [Magnetospirillum sp. SS-4]CAA7612429.1 PAS/PAC domain-containing protein [Magnetospirillum sp. SS-4]
MAKSDIYLTGVERSFGIDEIIVSKTDTKGRIIYANEVFLRMAGYSEAEILNQPHSIIRHPDMPRCVFKLLWDTIETGKEIFAYVKNRAKNGDHYWVLAHVTPTFDKAGNIVSYHSNRRSPRREAIEKAEGLYKQLLAIEQGHDDRKKGMEAAFQAVVATLQNAGVPYDEFVFSL